MTPSQCKVSMLIYAIISLLSLGRADTFPENWKISRRFLLFLFRPTTVSDYRKTSIALVIQGLLSLFPSLTSFNSAFGHSPGQEILAFSKIGCMINSETI